MIENYDCTTFPNWLGDAIFSNMVSLRLSKCKYCKSLPSLGQLSSLQELYIVEMERLQLLHSGFYRDGQFGIKPFRSMKILSFIKLPCWSVWTHDGEDIPFPSLQELQIQDCPQLIESLPKKLYSLTKLELSDCPKLLPFLEDSFPSKLQSVVITNCNNLAPQKQWGLHGMKSLTCFKIEGGCSEAELFPEEQLLPNTLTSIRISGFPNLINLGEGLHSLTSLKKLEISCCVKLELMPKEGLSPNLRSRVITNCTNLMPLKKWSIHGMKSLTCIKIDGGCSKLEVFPQGVLPNTLTYLCIRNLPNLINLGEGLHSLTSLKKLNIKHCKKLNKLMPKEGFPLKLQSLFITDCESILPSTEWGLHGMKSLAHFMITGGCSTMELFPERGLLPDSLISL